MSATVGTVRTCESCGVSIEHRRPQATTCSDACRQTKRRGGGYEPGACRGCGRELPSGRTHRWHCSRACALEPGTAPRAKGPLLATTCRCADRVVALADEDGQTQCLACGRPKGVALARVNGYDGMAAMMVARDRYGDPWVKPRKLSYGDARPTQLRIEYGKALRRCAQCGCYLRIGHRGPRCSPCAQEGSAR